ncbi:hypothetical protein LTR37_001785 [Vermiconidia calcicola]|uniref:Uncharacterized protein n=1 Tax=Vermiconidia calcicola TaxID=1690605 RepID=A0ACC3NV80_9PEZI|nr:hypothetical protein LTR37_001785 [Vermiconidia calcicola]
MFDMIVADPFVLRFLRGGIITGSSSVEYPFSLQASPIPTRQPQWTTAVPSVDSDDPYGALYTLQDYYEKETLSRDDIATFFPDDPFLLEIYGCSTPPQVAPATAVNTVGALLATSTRHITSAPKPETSKKPTTSTTQSPTTRATAEATTDHSPTTQPLPTPSPSPSPSPSDGDGESESNGEGDGNDEGNAEGEGDGDNDGDNDGEEPSSCNSTDVGCFVNTLFGGGSATPTHAAGTTFVAAGQTLQPGKPIVISGTTFALATTGSGIVVDGETQRMAGAHSAAITVNGVQFTQGGSAGETDLVADGHTLQPGKTIVLSGTTFALPSTGSGIVVDGETQRLAAAPTAAITVNGVPFTPVGGSGGRTRTTEYLIGGQTLVHGSTVVVSGSTFSLPTSGQGFYINGESASVPTNAAGKTGFSIGSIGVTPTDVPASPSYSGPLASENSAERTASSPLALSLSFLGALSVMVLL